jgi:myo-inositol-1(or 4)-monophosphatase
VLTLAGVWSYGSVDLAGKVDTGLDFNELRAVAVRVAREAAEQVRSSRGSAVARLDAASVNTKSTETDVVTAADTASERLVRSRLTRLRPGEPVLGEEEGGDAAGRDGLCWVVDPIDGTVNYLYGYPWYSVSLAAQVGGVSVAGAVVEPATGRIWSAARGHGAELDGVPLRVSEASRLDLALVATGFAYSAQRRLRQAAFVGRLLGRVRDIRRAGAASLDLCAVAAGWVDGYVEHGLKLWDWAAGALIAQEAGAMVRLPRSVAAPGYRDLPDDVVLAVAPGVADALRDALLECGIDEV